MRRVLTLLVLLASTVWSQTDTVAAYRFAQPGYPEMVLVWYTLQPDTMTAITVTSASGENRREYVFHPADARPVWGNLTYSIVIVPEGLGRPKSRWSSTS